MNDITWDVIECEKTPTNYFRFINSIKSNTNDQPDFLHGAKKYKIFWICA